MTMIPNTEKVNVLENPSVTGTKCEKFTASSSQELLQIFSYFPHDNSRVVQNKQGHKFKLVGNNQKVCVCVCAIIFTQVFDMVQTGQSHLVTVGCKTRSIEVKNLCFCSKQCCCCSIKPEITQNHVSLTTSSVFPQLKLRLWQIKRSDQRVKLNSIKYVFQNKNKSDFH